MYNLIHETPRRSTASSRFQESLPLRNYPQIRKLLQAVLSEVTKYQLCGFPVMKNVTIVMIPPRITVSVEGMLILSQYRKHNIGTAFSD
jgi:hypothetical protein